MNTQVILWFPKDVKIRLERVAKTLGTAQTAICKEATFEKLDYWERVFDENERRRQPQPQQKTETRRGFGSSPLSPSVKNANAKATISVPEAVASEETVDVLYREHAAKIAEVKNSPFEKQLRTIEAIRDIRTKFPLSHPSEPAIRHKLETMIVRPIEGNINTQIVAVLEKFLEFVKNNERGEEKNERENQDPDVAADAADRESYPVTRGPIPSGFSGRDGRESP